MDSEDGDQIEICVGRGDDETFRMEDRGAALLHYSEAELSASRINMKERRLLNRNWAKLEADRTYRMRCLETDLRLAELRKSRLAIRSARVKTHLEPEERAAYHRLDVSGKLRMPVGFHDYHRPAHLDPRQLIASAHKRLQSRGAPGTAASGVVRFNETINTARRIFSDSDSSSSSDSDSSTSTTESLRRLRRAHAAAVSRRPQTAGATAAPTTAAPTTATTASKALPRERLASKSCHASFFTASEPSRTLEPRSRRQQRVALTPRLPEHQRRPSLDKQRWAEAERRKLQELDGSVRELLQSVAELRL